MIVRFPLLITTFLLFAGLDYCNSQTSKCNCKISTVWLDIVYVADGGTQMHPYQKEVKRDLRFSFDPILEAIDISDNDC